MSGTYDNKPVLKSDLKPETDSNSNYVHADVSAIAVSHLLNVRAAKRDAIRPTVTVMKKPMAAYHAYEMR